LGAHQRITEVADGYAVVNLRSPFACSFDWCSIVVEWCVH
jgi:hypothetical protein